MLSNKEIIESQHQVANTAYEKTPFLADLTDESRERLEKLKFTIASGKIDTGAAELTVMTLNWPSMKTDIEDLITIFDEEASQTLGEAGGKTLGDLTDEEFRERLYKFSGENRDYSWYFQNRTVGKVGRKDQILAAGSNVFTGPLSDFYKRTNALMGGNNENLTKPAEGHKLAAREHMLWVPANLKLDDLSIGVHEKRVVRYVALLHDWGKAVMERNGQHPEIGASMVWSVLMYLHQQNPKLYPWRLIESVCWAIKMHHMLERVFSPTNENSMLVITNHRGEDDQLFAQQVVAMQQWLLSFVNQTNLIDLTSEPIINTNQIKELLEGLRILATLATPTPNVMTALAATTLEAVAELRYIQVDTNPNTLGLILGLVRMVEADLIATDRKDIEVESRINQLKLLTQGLLASFRSET